MSNKLPKNQPWDENTEDIKPKIFFEDIIEDDEIPEKSIENQEVDGQKIKFNSDEAPDEIPVDEKTQLTARGQIGKWPFRVDSSEIEDSLIPLDQDNGGGIAGDVQLDNRQELPHQPSDIKPDGIYEPEQEPPVQLSEDEKNQPHISPVELYGKDELGGEKIEPVNINRKPTGANPKKELLNKAAIIKMLDNDNNDALLAEILNKIMDMAIIKQRLSVPDIQKKFSLTHRQANYYLDLLFQKGLLEKFDAESKNIYYKPIAH